MKPRALAKNKIRAILISEKEHYEALLIKLSGQEKERLKESSFSLKDHLADTNIFPDINLSRIPTIRKVIYKVDEALKKVDKGTYGLCEDCGDPIPVERLQAVPFTTRCVECKKAAELSDTISKNGNMQRMSRPEIITV